MCHRQSSGSIFPRAALMPPCMRDYSSDQTYLIGFNEITVAYECWGGEEDQNAYIRNLSSYGVGTGRKQFGDASRLETRLRKTEGCTKTSTSSTHHYSIVLMVDDGVGRLFLWIYVYMGEERVKTE